MVARHDIPLVYHFFVDGSTPACEWDADWTLLRRNRSNPVRRQLVQGVEPWRWHWDRTLFEIRREPLSPWTGRLYLRVGGRSPAAATQNWNECAKPLRRLYRKSIRELESRRSLISPSNRST